MVNLAQKIKWAIMPLVLRCKKRIKYKIKQKEDDKKKY